MLLNLFIYVFILNISNKNDAFFDDNWQPFVYNNHFVLLNFKYNKPHFQTTKFMCSVTTPQAGQINFKN